MAEPATVSVVIPAYVRTTFRFTPRERNDFYLTEESIHALERIGFTIYSLPPDVRARIDYLQMIAERIVAPVSDARRA